MAWYDSNWIYRKEITIPASTVNGSTDLDNFRFPFVITDADFSKARADGFDFRFTTSDGTSIINHERVSWDNVANTLIVHFNITSFSATIDTKIYIYYDNPAAVDTSNSALVYDTEDLILHFEDDPTGTIKDSSTNNHTVTPNDTSLTQATGTVGGAVENDGGNHGFDIPDHTSLRPTTDLVVSCWIKSTSDPTGGVALIRKDIKNGVNPSWQLIGQNGNNTRFRVRIGAVNYNSDSTSLPFAATDTWFKLRGQRKGTDMKIIVNKTSEGQLSSVSGTIDDSEGKVVQLIYSNTENYQGILDEFIVSQQVETDDWYDTLYDIELNPTAAYTIGTEENESGLTPLFFGTLSVQQIPQVLTVKQRG